MGAPIKFAREAQAGPARRILKRRSRRSRHSSSIGSAWHTPSSRSRSASCGLITPWNWPLNQIVCKVAPALAAGCTMVLKPSEIAPLSAIIFAEILRRCGRTQGRLQPGQRRRADGRPGDRRHPDIDMVSFTGSTRAGILRRQGRRRHREARGARSSAASRPTSFCPMPISPVAVKTGVAGCFSNSGQSCDAPTRMFVPRDRHDEVAGDRQEAPPRAHRVGDPRRARDGSRPRRQPGAVRQDPAPDRERHRRRRDARHRRPGPPGGPQSRLFRPADDVRRRARLT